MFLISVLIRFEPHLLREKVLNPFFLIIIFYDQYQTAASLYPKLPSETHFRHRN